MSVRVMKKDDEYIELVKYIMSYAKEFGTLPGSKNPKYRDICNLRNGIKSGRISEERKSVAFIKNNFPDMIDNWENYKKDLESKESLNGKLNKKQLDSKLCSIINEFYPGNIYIGLKEIHDCLLVLRTRNEDSRVFILSDKAYTNICKFLKNGKDLALSYSDFVILSLILYGYRPEVDFLGRDEVVGSSYPCVNQSNDYIELYFKLLSNPDLDIYLNNFLDDTIYVDEKMYNATKSDNLDPMRNIICVYDHYSGKTLEETGKQFGISRERVRQIVVRATRRLIVKYRKQLQDILEERSYG
jgi:hypothetical protein